MPQKSIRRTQVSRVRSVSAPVGGLNARDPIAEMKETDAITLDNVFCTPYDVRLRNGSSQFATGITGQVNTLASYSPPSGSLKLFAAAGSKIYDASIAGAVGAAVVTGATSDKWQTINFGTAGGNFLLAVNGSDKLHGYDGTNWWVDGDGTHDITGVDSAKFINVCAFGSRAWFVEKNSLKVWYLSALSIAGAATSIDFSGSFSRGGYLVAMGSWSLDAGAGLDDYAVFVTSEGQVAVYKGSDPASAATFARVGIYDIGAPIGRRCFMKYAGDLTIICKDGLAPLSKALMSSRVNSRVMLTDKIQHLISQYTTEFGQNFGWETVLFPKENMLLVNVPLGNGAAYQLAMNTISGAWSRFLNWNANCFVLHDDELYFGSNGVVYKAWDTFADNGANINFEAQQSFSYMGRNGQLKVVKMLRPVISSDGNPSVLMGVNVDFDLSAPTGTPTFTPTTYAVWDSSTWDNAVWGGDLAIKKDWQSAFGIGFCMAAHMKGASSTYQLRWASTDFLLEDGGVL